jgi:hypothetical protein
VNIADVVWGRRAAVGDNQLAEAQWTSFGGTSAAVHVPDRRAGGAFKKADASKRRHAAYGTRRSRFGEGRRLSTRLYLVLRIWAENDRSWQT